MGHPRLRVKVLISVMMVVALGKGIWYSSSMTTSLYVPSEQQQQQIPSRTNHTTVSNNNNNNNNNNNKVKTKESLSACFLTMDDNHWLVEWLPFYYTVWGLRDLIVATDPRSSTTPEPVFQRWNDRINITVWKNFAISNNTLEEAVSRATFVDRQFTFLAQCLRTFKQQGKTWVMATDPDEFPSINTETLRLKRQQSNNNNNNNNDNDNNSSVFYRSYSPTAINQPGVLFQFLQQEAAATNTTCFSMPRAQFVPRELEQHDIISNTTNNNNTNTPQYSFLFSNATTTATDLLLTYRWQYRWGSLPGPKNVVNVQNVDWKDMPTTKAHVHRLVERHCENPRGLRSGRIFEVFHYFGSRDQFLSRDDARNTRQARWDKFEQKANMATKCDSLSHWLPAFVDVVQSPEEAKRLLEGVGRVDGWMAENDK